jgi:membrane-bound lytic murein transglycosylase F
MKKIRGLLIILFLFAVCDVGFYLIGQKKPFPTVLEKIKKRGTLLVLTKNAPTTYFVNFEGQLKGVEYELVESYAKKLGVKARYIVKNNFENLLSGLQKGEGDLIAAGLTQIDSLKERFLFGPVYQVVTPKVVCHRKSRRPSSFEDLTERVIKVGGESYIKDYLWDLKKENPNLNFQVVPGSNSEKLLEEVWREKVDCTIAYSNTLDINRRYFPSLVSAMDFGQQHWLSWMLPANGHELQRSLNQWFESFPNQKLEELFGRYYGYYPEFDYINLKTFLDHVQIRFPRYKKLFDEAGKENKIHPMLLASLAYQESKWNRKAKSPTGVRGMMMLTRMTAKSLGVENRLNSKESIFGGAKYLAKMKIRLDKKIKEPDRTWIALAAYNVGFGHILDAQELAVIFGKDPNIWRDLKEVLPLLRLRKYYKTLKHGYARGLEPVRYVQRIRDYLDILEKVLGNPGSYDHLNKKNV